MRSLIPLVFLGLLVVALQAQHRRSSTTPGWRPGGSGPDRDDERLLRDLSVRTGSTVAPSSGTCSASPGAVAKTRTTPARAMPTVVP
ncbi:hypothetical protein [Intrasporangium sp. DVR]|uniref:hypothetical protein n=1 Tax=Intrasporangium sp. DVR TaxID=3127867 RepID=UPI00333EBA0A